MERQRSPGVVAAPAAAAREGRGSPSLLGTESGRWTPGSFRGRHLSVFARLSVTGGRGFTGRAGSGLPPQGGTPGRFRPLVNFKSWRISVRFHYFQILSSRLLSQLSALAGYSAFYSRLELFFFHSGYGPPIPFISKYPAMLVVVYISKLGRLSASSKAPDRNSCLLVWKQTNLE